MFAQRSQSVNTPTGELYARAQLSERDAVQENVENERRIRQGLSSSCRDGAVDDAGHRNACFSRHAEQQP